MKLGKKNKPEKLIKEKKAKPIKNKNNKQPGKSLSIRAKINVLTMSIIAIFAILVCITLARMYIISSISRCLRISPRYLTSRPSLQ